MELNKNLTCCFTGHRPDKLNMDEIKVKQLLENAVDMAISKGFTIFVSGMADGIDLWAAQIVLKKRVSNSKIKLVCAMPYPKFQSKVQEMQNILQIADEVVNVRDHYFTGCFQVRNCYMVDNSNLVIAAFNGENGGTKNTLAYAKKLGVEIINVLDI